MEWTPTFPNGIEGKKQGNEDTQNRLKSGNDKQREKTFGVGVTILSYLAQLGRRKGFSTLFGSSPPSLGEPYDNPRYEQFMRAETHLFSPRYAKKNIRVHGIEHLQRGEGGVLAFLHCGSFFLSGGALVHQFGLPYTLIASRHNCELLPPPGPEFWRGVHKRSAELFRAPLFFSDESPFKMSQWLKEGKLLGAALDVRETGKAQKSDKFDFLGAQLYLHTGPGRLAIMAGKPMHAMTIIFDAERRQHDLYLSPPVREKTPHAMLQATLDHMAPIIERAPRQLYHDLFGIFSVPPTI